MLINALGLSLKKYPGAALSEADVDDLWRFRQEFVRLKPDVPAAADRANFGAVVRDCQTLGVLRDAQGIQGIGIYRCQPAQVAGERVVFVLPTYGFLRPRYRGHPLLVLLTLDSVVRAKLAFPRHRLIVIEAYYPLSYVSVVTNTSSPWTLRTPGISPWQLAVLRHAIDAFFPQRWDPHTGVVCMPTLPPQDDLTHRAARRPEALQALQTYLAENPRWAEGFALPLAVELGGMSVLAMVRAVARRAMRVGRSARK